MINWEGFAKTAAVIGGYFVIRVISGFRVDKRKQASMRTPLIDPILLETTFAPRPGEDANLLAELRDTLAHLNRQAYAEEFWNVSDHMAELDAKLPASARPTLRSALERMLETDSRWLQIVAAKACGALGAQEASAKLRELTEAIADSEDPVDLRLRGVLSDALAAIDVGVDGTASPA